MGIKLIAGGVVAVAALGVLLAWAMTGMLAVPVAVPPVAAGNEAATGDLQPADPSRALASTAQRDPVAPSPGLVPDDEPPFVAAWQLALRVIDASGAPVADAEVNVWLARRVSSRQEGNGYQGRLIRTGPYRQARTGADGRAMLSLDRETVLVRAHKDGAGSTGDRMIGARQQSGVLLELPLRPQVTLHGDVLDAADRPVADASIAIEVTRALGGTWMPGDQRWNEPSVRSDGNGRFTVHLDVQHVFTLTAVHDRARSFPALIDASSPGEQSCRLRMPGRHGIRGFVLGAGGEAVAAAVLVRERHWSLKEYMFAYSGHRERVATDARGAFTAFVPGPGRYDLVAIADGHAASPMVEVDVPLDAPFAHATLRLRTPGVVRGLVHTTAGLPLAGCVCELTPTDDGGATAWAPTALERCGTFTATSDADGVIAFAAADPDMTWRLRGTPPAGLLVPEPIEVRAGVPFVLSVAAEAPEDSVAGQVIAAETGAPIGKFTLRVVFVGEDGAEEIGAEQAFADANGRFRLGDLPARRELRLVCRAEGRAGCVHVLAERERARPAVLRLPQPGRLAVLVLDATGVPIVGARVSATPKAPLPDTVLQSPTVATTDAMGRCSFAGLDPDIWSVRARSADGAETGALADIQVMPGAFASVTVQTARR